MEFHGSWLRLLSLAALTILLLSGFSLLFSDRTSHCEMTYMFEYPKFVHVDVPGNELYPQYSLYAYSEGRLTERARKMQFTGIPVLYLPGNSGSRSQARSFASVALRMALSDNEGYHFDYFTVSFNEELSGLYGGVLEKQLQYSSLAIEKILSLYRDNRYSDGVQRSVVIIGHSMGGVLAKRLLVHDYSKNMTNIAITLAAPLQAPLLNFDVETDRYYMGMFEEWRRAEGKDKVLISFGSGARDLMVPSSYVGSEHSDLTALLTSVPGVWVSTDHLSIVWCRQFTIALNKFFFSIVDKKKRLVSNDKQFIMKKAHLYFQANRSMTLDSTINRPVMPMTQDAFWYEDNRRIYQISRPKNQKLTYLMIRLSGVHLDRFVAVETVNHGENEWIYGCTADNTNNNQRTCMNAAPLSEMSRWTATAKGFGRRKLATIHLHELMMQEPLWTHVLVKIPPNNNQMTINVDINDFASRNITVNLPSMLSFGKSIIQEETEKGAVYYELVLPGMTQLPHTYLLYVEPSPSCVSADYHVSAEMHIPWAKNSEYYHFFTATSKKPMKLRLFHSQPNMDDDDSTEHAKVTLLLDPACTFSISIEPSRYYSIAQLTRQHLPVLTPYVAAIMLLATRSMIMNLAKTGGCQAIHSALADEALRPYFPVVFARLGTLALSSVPLLAHIFSTSNINNSELNQLTKSLLTVPLYMASLGALNVTAAGFLVAIVSCSQLAHRLVLRILWRGSGGSLAEKLTGVLQKAPVLVSAALVVSVPTSCGAASLAAGAAFYFFMLSKMYEEYLEDVGYKLLAKLGGRVKQYFKSRTNNINTTNASSELVPSKSELNEDKSESNDDQEYREKLILNVLDKNDQGEDVNSESKTLIKLENKCEKKNNMSDVDIVNDDSEDEIKLKDKQIVTQVMNENTSDAEEKNIQESKETNNENEVKIDEELSGLHFHLIMFHLYMIVVGLNIPALLTWARNFKFGMVLRPDTSFYSGLVMSVSVGFLWQINTPRRNLKHYETVSQFLYLMSMLVIVMGPLAPYYINYIVTASFVLITAQQVFDTEVTESEEEEVSDDTGLRDEVHSESNGESEIYNKIQHVREKMEFAES